MTQGLTRLAGVAAPSHLRLSGGQVEIENSFSNLQTKLAAFSRPPYVPPQGQSLDDIAVAWDSLNNAEATQ